MFFISTSYLFIVLISSLTHDKEGGFAFVVQSEVLVQVLLKILKWLSMVRQFLLLRMLLVYSIAAGAEVSSGLGIFVISGRAVLWSEITKLIMGISYTSKRGKCVLSWIWLGSFTTWVKLKEYQKFNKITSARVVLCKAIKSVTIFFSFP